MPNILHPFNEPIACPMGRSGDPDDERNNRRKLTVSIVGKTAK